MTSALHILQDTFGYTEFRPPQQAIIDDVQAGCDVLAIMPTGGGKSLCYQIPALLREGTGIIISPLIALMQDQVDAMAQLGVRAAFLNSSLGAQEAYEVEQALLSGQLDLLYIAPERLVQERMLDLLHRSTLSVFGIDEAHCVSQWGHDFRVDYLSLNLLSEQFPQVPRIALTATADARTQQEIIERLALKEPKHYISGFDRPNIQYRITARQNAKQQLLRFLRREHEHDAGIVYCLSRKKVEATADWLEREGFDALPYHAGLAPEIRQRNQQRFLREDSVIIVATIAFGMGIDKPDVRFIAHLDLPKSIESYYQETGRAGRDGEPATAWMSYGLQDVIKLRQMMEGSSSSSSSNSNNRYNSNANSNAKSTEEFKRAERYKLDAMLGLCEITSCRRHALLEYFGESSPTQCGNCDTCITPTDTWDGTEATRKALSCVFRTGQRFGVGHLIDVLLGAETAKIRQWDHQQISTYGIGKELNSPQWSSVFRQLVARGHLQVNIEAYGALQLTDKCRPILRGEESIDLRRDVAEKSSSKKLRKSRGEEYNMKEADRVLWEALRETRKRLADEQGVPPYVIFHDATLMGMMEYRPLDEAALRNISGVGDTKLQRYGADFLEVIRAHEDPAAGLGHGYGADISL